MTVTEFDITDTQIDHIDLEKFTKHRGIGIAMQIYTKDGRVLKVRAMWSMFGAITETMAALDAALVEYEGTKKKRGKR